MTTRDGVAIVVITKPPTVAKSRLRDECGAAAGDQLVEAMILDTLDAVAASSARERVVALTGDAGAWLPAGFGTIVQRGGGLAERLASVFDDVGAPAIVIAIDTPQVTAAILDDAAEALLRDGTDAVLGPATDGGFWAIGLREADPRMFLDIPMSTGSTGNAQWQRLRALELTTHLLPELRDIDDLDDAIAVAAQVPDTRLARTMSLLNVEAR